MYFVDIATNQVKTMVYMGLRGLSLLEIKKGKNSAYFKN
jgi:hypothetical protein